MDTTATRSTAPGSTEQSQPTLKSGYAAVNGLQMYYEIHGERRSAEPPLLLLHGGPTTILTSFGLMLPTLTEKRQIVAIEQQGHGHTADIDREMSYEQMAEDTAAALKHLGINGADVLGFSDGGVVGLGLAIRYPELVRKVIVAGTNYSVDGLTRETVKFLKDANPGDFGQLREAYEKVAPRPGDWPKLVSKVMKMAVELKGWPEDGLHSVRAPMLIVVGDRDMVRPEHAVELFRLVPNSQLAILPGMDHVALVLKPERLLAESLRFLDAPMPDKMSA